MKEPDWVMVRENIADQLAVMYGVTREYMKPEVLAACEIEATRRMIVLQDQYRKDRSSTKAVRTFLVAMLILAVVLTLLN